MVLFLGGIKLTFSIYLQISPNKIGCKQVLKQHFQWLIQSIVHENSYQRTNRTFTMITFLNGNKTRIKYFNYKDTDT